MGLQWASNNHIRGQNIPLLGFKVKKMAPVSSHFSFDF